MTLHALVAALGGDLYGGGLRANVPAPGHGRGDRSVSLLLTEGRLVIHGFGGVDWRAVRDDLRRRGLIDAAGVPGGVQGLPQPTPRPDAMERARAAQRLWDGVLPVGSGSAAAAYLRRRAIADFANVAALGFHPAAPVSVYTGRGFRKPALVARIHNPMDELTAVEIAYLEPNGLSARSLRLSRKTVGYVLPGSAVRFSDASAVMVVGEGVATTLSAMAAFSLPGWALMSAHNLAAWAAPDGVRRVIIAADRGAVGANAAARLARRLRCAGVAVEIRRPRPPFGDWNEAAVAAAAASEERTGKGGKGRRNGEDSVPGWARRCR